MSAIREARKQVAANPDIYFYPTVNNDANWRAHYETNRAGDAGPDRGPHHPFRSVCGTSGTIRSGRRLREADPASQADLVSAPTRRFTAWRVWKHMETAPRAGHLDPSLADQDMRVSTEDAYTMVRRLAREEGLLVGISGGAALAGALIVSKNGPGCRDASPFSRQRRANTCPSASGGDAGIGILARHIHV